jgi:hypothetical protein
VDRRFLKAPWHHGTSCLVPVGPSYPASEGYRRHRCCVDQSKAAVRHIPWRGNTSLTARARKRAHSLKLSLNLPKVMTHASRIGLAGMAASEERAYPEQTRYGRPVVIHHTNGVHWIGVHWIAFAGISKRSVDFQTEARSFRQQQSLRRLQRKSTTQRHSRQRPE